MLSDRDARPADGPASAASHGRRLSPSGRRGGRQRVACLPERGAPASGGRIRRRPGAVSQRRRSRRRRRVRATAPGAPSAEPQVAARAQGEHFEVRTAQGWEPFYVKGINLGAALPGKFPSQFPPDDSTYARWLELIAAANANTVRLYTILPPAFY